MLSERYQSEQRELDVRISALTAELEKSDKETQDTDKWIALIKQCAHPTELSAELLNTLIEKIVVHEAVKDTDGKRKQKVDIYYRFIGKIDYKKKAEENMVNMIREKEENIKKCS